MLKITKNPKPDEERPGMTRQDEAAPRQEGVPWFWKILYEKI